jgi:hypothetical protein
VRFRLGVEPGKWTGYFLLDSIHPKSNRVQKKKQKRTSDEYQPVSALSTFHLSIAAVTYSDPSEPQKCHSHLR